MMLSLSIGPCMLLSDCNHSATATIWRSAEAPKGVLRGSDRQSTGVQESEENDRSNLSASSSDGLATAMRI